MKPNKPRQLIFLVVVLSLILFPGINTCYIKKDSSSLVGVENESELPDFTIESFWDGSFQSQYDEAISHGFSGYRFAMKLLNELRFRLFQQVGDKVVGKDGSIIFSSFIDEYLGLSEDYMCSNDYIDQLISQLKEIKALAEEKGKQIIVMVTPNKAEFMKEQIPDKYYSMKKLYDEEDRSIHQLTAKMNLEGIPYIDGAALLLEKANELTFDVFPYAGIHWTREAALHTLNATLEKLEENGNSHFKRLSVAGRSLQSEPKRDSLNKDDDLWQLMNVFSKPNTQYSYPIEIEELPEKYEQPAIFIQGGSFSFSICELLAQHDMVKDLNFLFYAQTLYDYDEESYAIQSLYDQRIERKIQDSDIIILEVNEQAVNQMGSGFYPVLAEVLRKDIPQDDQSFQVYYRGFSPWESQGNASWKWALGKSALLVFQNVSLDDLLEVTFWVPYSGYMQNIENFTGPVDIDVFVNGVFFQEYNCSEDSIYTIQIRADQKIAEQGAVIEIRSPYSFAGWTSSGIKEISMQVLNAGRVE